MTGWLQSHEDLADAWDGFRWSYGWVWRLLGTDGGLETLAVPLRWLPHKAIAKTKVRQASARGQWLAGWVDWLLEGLALAGS